MDEANEHKMYDAILMSASALAVMANIRYQVWRNYTVLATRGDEEHRKFATEMRDRDSAILRRLCERINEAMQYIGDVNNGCDATDEHGMTDAAFAAMDRALRR